MAVVPDGAFVKYAGAPPKLRRLEDVCEAFVGLARSNPDAAKAAVRSYVKGLKGYPVSAGRTPAELGRGHGRPVPYPYVQIAPAPARIASRLYSRTAGGRKSKYAELGLILLRIHVRRGATARGTDKSSTDEPTSSVGSPDHIVHLGRENSALPGFFAPLIIGQNLMACLSPILAISHGLSPIMCRMTGLPNLCLIFTVPSSIVMFFKPGCVMRGKAVLESLG